MKRSVTGLALLSVLASAGCVVLPILGGLPPRDEVPVALASDGFATAAVLDGFADVRGIVHCHSRLSHDCSGSFESIADAAAETSCAFVALCDHLTKRTDVKDEPTGRIQGVLFLPGAEMNSNGGSILAIGVAAGIDRYKAPDDIIRQIRALGGVAAIGHPESMECTTLAEADGCELENLHADVLDDGRFSLAMRFLFFPPRAFFSSIVDRQNKAMAVYDAFARTKPLAAIGACDAHEAIRPLGPLAGAVDSYRRTFRTASTHLLVPLEKTGDKLDPAAVLEALRAGRTYAASELLQDATGFRFVARGPRGSATLGGAIGLEKGVGLEAALPAVGDLTLYRDGAPVIAAVGTTTLGWRPLVPGAYRIEASYGGKPWIWSSAIRVEER